MIIVLLVISTIGTQIGDTVVIFEGSEYMSNATKHIIVGLTPLKQYHVYKSGSLVKSLVASQAGVISVLTNSDMGTIRILGMKVFSKPMMVEM